MLHYIPYLVQYNSQVLLYSYSCSKTYACTIKIAIPDVGQISQHLHRGSAEVLRQPPFG
jgi:hypothetical protein